MVNLVWLQGATDNGCTVSFLNSQQPGVLQIITKFNVNIAFHPTINLTSGPEALKALEPFARGKTPLDILIVEGAVQRGPNGTGEYCLVGGRPFKDILHELAGVASYTVAIGTCASFGGVAATSLNPTDATGLQFHKKERGGFLGTGYKSKTGLPVINISGCPAHNDWVTQTLTGVLIGKASSIALDEYQRPLDFFTTLSHHGCPNNEYFEFRLGATQYTDQGCLFEHLGCKGPLTHSDCNARLWNRQSSKTRVGSPCLGCTEPGFPEASVPFYKTPRIAGLIPKALPLEAPRIRYIAASAASKLARPRRLKKKRTL